MLLWVAWLIFLLESNGTMAGLQRNGKGCFGGWVLLVVGIGLLLILMSNGMAAVVIGTATYSSGAGVGDQANTASSATTNGTLCRVRKQHQCPSGTYGQAVASAAVTIADHLSGSPDTSYDGTIPVAALDYWNNVCPPGSLCFGDWQQGSLQCVFLVTGAFALAGHPLPFAPNAIQFWADYQGTPGFAEFATAQGALPEIGDIAVMDDSDLGGVGHVAVVINVTPPTATHTGTVTFAQANAPSAFLTTTVAANGSVAIWPGFTVLGYIRTT